MKKIDWSKAFEKRPESFHESVNSALSEISNREENNMSKVSLKKKVIITAAAVMAIGATAIAAGRATGFTSHSDIRDTVYNLEEAQKMSDDAKLDVTYPEELNGFVFESALPISGSAEDSDGNTIKEYESFSVNYKNGGDKVRIYIDPTADIEALPDEDPTKVVNGVNVYASENVFKFVPPDYEKTEQDLEDEAAGKIAISYGTDEVEIMTMRHVTWQDGMISYTIQDSTGTIDMDVLVEMAEEMINAQK